MILTVEFPYEESIIVKRGRTAKEFFLRGHAEVKIEETTGDKAPIAIRWKPFHDRHNLNERMDVRWWDGFLWEPLYNGSSSDAVHVTADALRDQVVQNKRYDNPLAVGQDWRLERAQRKEDIDVRQTVSSDRDKVVAQVEACAAGLVIIDGMVFQRSEEPVYVVQNGFGFSRVECHYVNSATNERKSGLVFRADRWDDAAAACHKGDDVEADDKARMEILMPEVLRYDDETPVIKSAAGHALDRMGNHLKGATRSFMLAYADLRDVINEQKPIEPDLVEAMVAAASACGQDDTLEGVARRLTDAVERWRMRPVSVDDADAVSYPGLG